MHHADLKYLRNFAAQYSWIICYTTFRLLEFEWWIDRLRRGFEDVCMFVASSKWFHRIREKNICLGHSSILHCRRPSKHPSTSRDNLTLRMDDADLSRQATRIRLARAYASRSSPSLMSYYHVASLTSKTHNFGDASETREPDPYTVHRPFYALSS